MVIPQQWRMTGLVMFCFVLGSWADRVCIFPSRSPHFLFSGILHHLGMGLLCIWASGLMDLGFFPFKVFQHIDIMSHHALLQYSSLFPFIWNQDNPIMCPRRTIGLESSLSLGQTGYKRGIVPQCQTYVALSWGSCDVLKERTWRVAKYGVPYSEFVLCISPIQVHTHTHTHTHREHFLPDLRLKPATFRLQVRLYPLGHNCPQFFFFFIKENVCYVTLMSSYFLQ